MFYLSERQDQTQKGGENKPIQAQNGAKRANIPNTHEKPRKTQIISPQGQQRGETMTAEKWETLKQAQRQAIKGGNIAEINRINKMLFKERERRQKAKERAREQEREKVISAKISSFCEKMLSAENGREL